MRYEKTMIRFAALSAALFMMAGCAVKKIPPTHSYALSTITPGIEKLKLGTPRFDALRIVTAHSNRISQSMQIYYQDGNFRRQPYAYSRWYDTVDTMLQNKILTALDRAHIARALLPAATSADANTVLEIDTIDFIQDFSQDRRCVAKITLLATLIDNKTGKSLDSRLFQAQKSCTSGDVPGGVAALNAAADALTLELVQWVESAGDRR